MRALVCWTLAWMFLRPFADNGDGWRRTSFNFVRVTFDLRCGSYFHNFFKKRVIDIPFPFEVFFHGLLPNKKVLKKCYTKILWRSNAGYSQSRNKLKVI